MSHSLHHYIARTPERSTIRRTPIWCIPYRFCRQYDVSNTFQSLPVATDLLSMYSIPRHIHCTRCSPGSSTKPHGFRYWMDMRYDGRHRTVHIQRHHLPLSTMTVHSLENVLCGLGPDNDRGDDSLCVLRSGMNFGDWMAMKWREISM